MVNIERSLVYSLIMLFSLLDLVGLHLFCLSSRDWNWKVFYKLGAVCYDTANTDIPHLSSIIQVSSICCLCWSNFSCHCNGCKYISINVCMFCVFCKCYFHWVFILVAFLGKLIIIDIDQLLSCVLCVWFFVILDCRVLWDTWWFWLQTCSVGSVFLGRYCSMVWTDSISILCS